MAPTVNALDPSVYRRTAEQVLLAQGTMMKACTASVPVHCAMGPVLPLVPTDPPSPSTSGMGEKSQLVNVYRLKTEESDASTIIIGKENVEMDL
ncbi:hypothetical protein J6590_001048 [Homalodisca vitripennis]|nr:hypothetical protein J6590_001048 [Homalodisca vitripennis]